jgi:hypothetical protein
MTTFSQAAGFLAILGKFVVGYNSFRNLKVATSMYSSISSLKSEAKAFDMTLDLKLFCSLDLDRCLHCLAILFNAGIRLGAHDTTTPFSPVLFVFIKIPLLDSLHDLR